MPTDLHRRRRRAVHAMDRARAIRSFLKNWTINRVVCSALSVLSSAFGCEVRTGARSGVPECAGGLEHGLSQAQLLQNARDRGGAAPLEWPKGSLSPVFSRPLFSRPSSPANHRRRSPIAVTSHRDLQESWIIWPAASLTMCPPFLSSSNHSLAHVAPSPRAHCKYTFSAYLFNLRREKNCRSPFESTLNKDVRSVRYRCGNFPSDCAYFVALFFFFFFLSRWSTDWIFPRIIPRSACEWHDYVSVFFFFAEFRVGAPFVAIAPFLATSTNLPNYLVYDSCLRYVSGSIWRFLRIY